MAKPIMDKVLKELVALPEDVDIEMVNQVSPIVFIYTKLNMNRVDVRSIYEIDSKRATIIDYTFIMNNSIYMFEEAFREKIEQREVPKLVKYCMRLAYYRWGRKSGQVGEILKHRDHWLSFQKDVTKNKTLEAALPLLVHMKLPHEVSSYLLCFF
jgi:hypothetical protein